MMKRLVRCLLWFGFVLFSAASYAQTPPGSTAQVYAVPATGEAARFKVPQVRLPDAAVARRINGHLLRFFTDHFGSLDSTATPRRQLQQAARECCYVEELRLWAAAGQGLTGLEYAVLLNQNYLLSLEFSHSWGGLEQPGTQHLTFDLRTGRRLTLAELVADPPAQLARRFQAAISRRLRDELANVAANYGDSAIIEHVARLYDINNWNAAPKRGIALDIAETGDETDNAWFAYTEFALTPTALLLFHPVGMSRLDFEFLPDETYTFPYERLQPRPVLLPVVRSAAGRKTKVPAPRR